MTSSKEATLARLNNNAQNAHEEAKEVAQRKGRPAPPAPVPLTAKDIEFPKWLHKGWKPGQQEPESSMLAQNAEEMAELEQDGYEAGRPVPAKKAEFKAEVAAKIAAKKEEFEVAGEVTPAATWSKKSKKG